MRELLTASSRRVFAACPRRYRFEYVLGYRPRAVARARGFGAAIHAALEAWWTSGSTSVDDRFGDALDALPHGMEPYDEARARAMIAGYASRWADDAEQYEALAVEAEFRLPLLHPETLARHPRFDLGGKVDGIVRERESGRVLVIEHKTSSSEDVGGGSDYRSRLAIDGQVSQYLDGAEALRLDAVGVLYDVLVKPGLKPLGITQKRKAPETPEEFEVRLAAAIAEDPERFLVRSEVSRAERERADFGFDVWTVATWIARAEEHDEWPRNPDACFRYGSRCPFWPVCSGAGSLDDDTVYRRVTGAHEELSAASNAA